MYTYSYLQLDLKIKKKLNKRCDFLSSKNIPQFILKQKDILNPSINHIIIT